MINLQFKISLSEGAKYVIEKMGGVQLVEKYLESNSEFNQIKLVNKVIIDEIINFYKLRHHAPYYFLQFKFILEHYLISSKSNVKKDIEKIIEIYNLDLNESFDSFYEKLKNLKDIYLKDKFKLGRSKVFKVSEFLNELILFNEFLNGNPVEYDLNYGDKTDDLIKNYFQSQNSINRFHLENALKLCQSTGHFLARIFNDNFIEHLSVFLNENEKYSLKNSISGFKAQIENNSDFVSSEGLEAICLEKIKILHLQLESLYEEFINLVPSEKELYKARLQSDVGLALKFMKKIENKAFV